MFLSFLMKTVVLIWLSSHPVRSWVYARTKTFSVSWIWTTVEPQLSEPHGRHTIRSDNRGVQIDEGNRNSPSMGYRVGDN